MIEKVTKISNPLTIIAIFAALAEVASSAVLVSLPKEVQITFVWFVMAFPMVLVVAFFVTLNMNPRALYAPSDFKNEDNFIKIHDKKIMHLTKSGASEALTLSNALSPEPSQEIRVYKLLALVEQLLSPDVSSFNNAQKDELQSALIELSNNQDVRESKEFKVLLEKAIDLYAAAGLSKEMLELDARFDDIMTSEKGILTTMLEHFGRTLLGEREFSERTYAIFDKYARAAENIDFNEATLPFRLPYEFAKGNSSRVAELIEKIKFMDQNEVSTLGTIFNQLKDPHKLAKKPRPDISRLSRRVTDFLEAHRQDIELTEDD